MLWGFLLAWAAASAEPPPTVFTPAGRLESPQLTELSGLAVSRRSPRRWWGHNDSGDRARLFELEADGRHRRAVTVAGALNADWEDLASYRLDGRQWLAIADTGDNFSLRSQVSIWVVPEPEEAASATAAAREIRFSYEDGPRDCEALAADLPARRFLLVDKGRQPAGLYAVPMQPPPGAPVVARRIADLPRLWDRPPPPAEPIGAAQYRGAVTALDLSEDARRLLLLSYTHLALIERHAGEDWPQALRRPPSLLRLPRQRLFEALGLSADGREALLGAEGAHSTLFRWHGSPPPASSVRAP